MSYNEKIRAFLGLGSNLGDKKANIEKARLILSTKPGIFYNSESSIYCSPAVDLENQPDFYNRVIEIETFVSPEELLEICFEVEDEMGRERKTPKGPRIIDIDILTFGDYIIKGDTLTIPHPELFKRAFNLIPLKEIKGDIFLPGSSVRITGLLSKLESEKVTKLETGRH